METRRRRVGSESDQHQQHFVTVEASYDKHEGKLKNYPVESKPNSSTCTFESISGFIMAPLKDFGHTVSTARDRTMEFAKLIQTLQSRNVKRAVNLSGTGRNALQTQRHAEFMMIARTIGRNVAGTYAKLQKLTLLASNKSLVKDQPLEIQELTYIIREDINSLNQQIGKLQEIAKGQKEKRKHLQSHTSNVVLGLQTKLANMTTEFKQVLEVRTENLRHQKSRREQYVAETSSNSSSSLHVQEHGSKQPQSKLLVPDAVSIDLDADGSSSDAMTPLLRNQHQQQTQMVSYDQTDDYLQSRADAMQNIESTIVELGGIFQQLAHLVKEQEEMVERIDSNVDAVGLDVDAAHSELVKYFKSVSSNRKLMLKVFGILIFFFIFFVVFMT